MTMACQECPQERPIRGLERPIRRATKDRTAAERPHFLAGLFRAGNLRFGSRKNQRWTVASTAFARRGVPSSLEAALAEAGGLEDEDEEDLASAGEGEEDIEQNALWGHA